MTDLATVAVVAVLALAFPAARWWRQRHGYPRDYSNERGDL